MTPPSTLLGPAVAIVVAIVLAGCAAVPLVSRPTPKPQTPAELASGAFKSWSKASAFQFDGTEKLPAAGTLDLTLTESSNGHEAQGTGALDGQPFSYLATSGKQYIRGQSFWQTYFQNSNDGVDPTLAKGFGDKYVELSGDTSASGMVPDLDIQNEVSSSLADLNQLYGAVTDLKYHPYAFKKGKGTRTIDGKSAIPLTATGSSNNGAYSGSGTETFWVSKNPDRIVGFSASAVNTPQAIVNPGPDTSFSVDVTIAVANARRVPPPAQDQIVNFPADPSTIPAFYTVVPTGPGNNPDSGTANDSACDSSSCQLQATIENVGGGAQAPGKAQLAVAFYGDESNGPSANCTVDIPTIASNQDDAVSCTVSGAAWSAIWNKVLPPGEVPIGQFQPSGLLSVTAQITDNPPYLGS